LVLVSSVFFNRTWVIRVERGMSYRSVDTLLNSAAFSGFVWMRRLAVRTNWPTVALKPERKALKGCRKIESQQTNSYIHS
jgi:hypothetical protein